MPRSSYPKFQLKPNGIAKYVSFLVVLCIILVGLFFDTWIEPSLMKDQRGRIWASLIRLFGFMAFVWAVVIMILDGVPFVRLQKPKSCLPTCKYDRNYNLKLKGVIADTRKG
ncbi:hypothetical protein P8452_65446 [Trifolium repens]|nr:hypothetical protein P8452_65446 [Trifolium repens]